MCLRAPAQRLYCSSTMSSSVGLGHGQARMCAHLLPTTYRNLPTSFPSGLLPDDTHVRIHACLSRQAGHAPHLGAGLSHLPLGLPGCGGPAGGSRWVPGGPHPAGRGVDRWALILILGLQSVFCIPLNVV